VVYNSKLTRALVGAKREALSDKSYAFSAKERQFFKEYERIATGRDRRRAWSYKERVEALRELYNDNKHYLSKKALNSVKAVNSAISEYIGEKEVANKETVYTGLGGLNKRADHEYYNRGFLGAIRKYGHAATGVAAGLLLFVNTSLISPNYISAEEPTQPKKVITIENKEPEKKKEIEQKPKVEKKKPEEKPEQKPVIKDAKESFGLQLYNPLQLYGSQKLRFDGLADNGEYGFRVFGSANVPPPEKEQENSIIMPEKLFCNVNGGDESDEKNGITYNRSFYNYILGSKSRLGFSYFNGGGDRMSRETVTPTDETEQKILKEFNAFGNNFYLPNGILTLSYSNLKGTDDTKVNILQPIQLTVRTGVKTEENRLLIGYNHMLNKNLSLGGSLSTAKADADANVDGVRILDETWRTWKLDGNIYKQNDNVAWYLGPNFTQGKGVEHNWGGDAFLLKPLGKGIIGGFEVGDRDGMRRGGLVIGKTPLDEMALYNKRMIDLWNDNSLTKEQKEIAERDYLRALALNSGPLFNISYNEQTPEEGGFLGFGILPLGKGWRIVGYGESGDILDKYGTFAAYSPGKDNRLSFDFGVDRINPADDEGSWAFKVGLSYWFGDTKKKDGKDGKK